MSYMVSRKQARDEAAITAWRLFHEAGGKLPLTLDTLEGLQSGMLGRIVLPSSADYDASRKLFNPLFDIRPSIIAYCDVENDVRLCLQTALAANMAFTVRAGGHSTAGYSGSTGMVIDVGGIDDVCVDAGSMTATVGAGCSFGKLNSALDQYGLHVPGGGCSDVRVGGYMQGGGYGFTSRVFGMNCDNVLEVRVMLWDGTVVTANEQKNHDLWWAIRGGTGGNFGVLLTVRYRLHKLGDVLAFAIRWPLADQNDLGAVQGFLCLQAQFMKSGHFPGFSGQLMIGMQSDAPPDHPDPHPWLLLRGMHVGTQAEGQAALRPLLATASAELQWSRTGSYNALVGPLMSQPHTIPQLNPKLGMTYEIKRSRYVANDIPSTGWQSIVAQWKSAPNRFALVALELYGGAINALPRDNSAFIHRDVAFDAFTEIFWYDPAEADPAQHWLDASCTVLEPFWNGHVYQNYPSGAEPDYRSNYWGEAFDALLAVKRKFDPHTAFTFPQAILPRDTTPAAPVNAPPRVADALAKPTDYR